MMRSLLCAFVVSALFTPLSGAEQGEHTATNAPCGQAHPTKKHFGRKVLGFPGAIDKTFSNLALGVSSIGIPQAQCELGTVQPKKFIHTAKRRTAEPQRM